MTELVYILLSVLMLIGLFALVYLKGKSVQMVFSGAREAFKGKKEKKDLINWLITNNISSIDINKGQEFSIHVSDAKAIEMFKKSLENNEVCKLSEKNRLDGPTFQIYVSGGKHTFESYLSPAYKEDVFVRLLDKYKKYYIKFPGLKRWLDENALNEEKK